MHLDVLFVVGRGAQEFTARVRQYPTITRVKNSREVLFPLLFSLSLDNFVLFHRLRGGSFYQLEISLSNCLTARLRMHCDMNVALRIPE